jgi:hypothetical protein
LAIGARHEKPQSHSFRGRISTDGVVEGAARIHWTDTPHFFELSGSFQTFSHFYSANGARNRVGFGVGIGEL